MGTDTIDICGTAGIRHELRTLPINQIKPNKHNARIRSEADMDALVASILQNGVSSPAVVDENCILIAGHGRAEAMRRAGYTEAPVIMIHGLSEQQKRALLLADNKIAERASWDTDKLVEELTALIDLDIAPENLGFTTIELDTLLDPPKSKKASDKADEEVPAVPFIPTSRRDDLWLCGSHRVYCGDSTNAADFETLMNGKKARQVVTDPPYNRGQKNISTKINHADFVMAAGEMSDEQFTAFLSKVFANLIAYSEDGSVHHIFMDWAHLPNVFKAALPLYVAYLNLCIWVKPNGGMGGNYRAQHEVCTVFKNGKGKYINNMGLGSGDKRCRTNVWQYPGGSSLHAARPDEMSLHPTVKPTRMIMDAIRDCSKRGDIILDAFCGSGTILIAAQRTRRVAYTMELDPKYVDVAVERWQRETGEQAVLAATGQTFDEVARAREVTHG